MFLIGVFLSLKGLTDQYADGKAAKVWQLYIGDTNSRTRIYKDFLIDSLKKRGCVNVLDVACGTGYLETRTDLTFR